MTGETVHLIGTRRLIDDDSQKIFSYRGQEKTEDYITGRFG